MTLEADIQAKLVCLKQILESKNPLIVAYSGGTDSAFLMRVAFDVLGDRMVALTARSPSLPAEEFEAAVELVQSVGARHIVVHSNELERGDYAKNPVNRCYFCKSELYELCFKEADRLGWKYVADGTNLDDMRDWRPGRQAASERAVLSPLCEAGLSKSEIRTLSKFLGLTTWDKPAMPCLSSRFPYGVSIDRERLNRVANAERAMKSLGFRQFRVRFHEEIARLEIAEEEIHKCLDAALRKAISEAILSCGFRFVVLDLEGYRSGRLNEGVIPLASS